MFKGNEKLRSAGEQFNYNKHRIDELIKCKEDIIYFAEKYFTIVNTDSGMHVIKLHDFQKKILKSFVDDSDPTKPNVVLKSSRQVGKCVSGNSTITVRNKKTKEISTISFKNLFSDLSNK